MPLPAAPATSELTCCGSTPASLHFSMGALSWMTRSKLAERSTPSSASGTSLPVLWWDNSKLGSTRLRRRFPKGTGIRDPFFTGFVPFSGSFPTSLLYFLETLPHKLLGPKSCLSEETLVFQCSSVQLFLSNIFVHLAVLGLHCRTLFSWGEWGLLPSWGAEAYHCGGFSRGAQAK